MNAILNHAQFEHWVPFPLERVFVFFANPHNLPRIMPPASDTRIDALRLTPPTETHENSPATSAPELAGIGSQIVTSFRVAAWLPFRARWVAQVTEFEWNRYFADIQSKGPFKSWHHRHEFESETVRGVSGTIVRDRIEYEVGFGGLGAIAQHLFVGSQVAHIFVHRQGVLEQLLRVADRNA